MGRAVGLDLHRDFCEVAICEDGVVRSAGRVKMTPEALEVLGAGLEPTDRVAMEVSGGSWEVAQVLEAHVQKVVVVSPDDTGIAQARTKTDKLDARALAKLLWQGELNAVWMPDKRCRVLRRRLSRREQLVRSRSRCKGEVHAVQARRLMTVPGVNLIATATFLAAIGEISRFSNSRRLVAYLGLDPRVRQSGEQPARSGRISKRGSASARWALVEAAWSVVCQPGPLRAYYQRIRSRRGHGKAIVAAARKLVVLFWCMPTRGQDYAHQQPSLTAQKLRRLEITAGAPVRKGKPSGVWVTHARMRHAEKELAAQAQASYERTVRDWKAASPKNKA